MERLELSHARLEDAPPILRARSWSTRRDSNSHPSPSEGDAHPIELRVVELVDGGRIELPIAGCRPAVFPLSLTAQTCGARRQNRTDVTEVAALCLATRQAVHVLERIVGLEPALSRWQRAVLATGRYPHGLRERTRTPANDVRSVGARPWDAEILLVGAGDGSRTRVSGLEAHRAATTPHPLSSRALHHRTRGRLRTLATVAEVESAARGFGDRSSATASRPIWGDRRDSNSLTADSQSARAPYCVRPPRDTLEPPARFERASPRYKGGRLPIDVQRLEHWGHRRESNALLPHYQCGVQPAELRRLIALARTTGLEPARNLLTKQGRCRSRTIRTHLWRSQRDLNPRFLP